MEAMKAKIYATPEQRATLLKWVAGARWIYNSKVNENAYLSTFARKYMPIGTYPDIDKKFSHFKSGDGEWLKEIPSPILREACNKWVDGFFRYLKSLKSKKKDGRKVGKPKLQRRDRGGDIVLDSTCFKIEKQTESHVYLLVGQKNNNIGILKVKRTKRIGDVSSARQIRISYRKGIFTLSLVFGESEDAYVSYANDTIQYLKDNESLENLLETSIGVDRGVRTPFETNLKSYDLTNSAKRKVNGKERFIKRQQRKLHRQVKGSKKRNKTKAKIQKAWVQIHNIREDFSHKVSHDLVVKSSAKIICLENLNIAGMTKSSKGTKAAPGKKVAQKRGLNKSILSKGWGSTAAKIQYKAQRNMKIVVKINPAYTSQTCSCCGHVSKESRNAKAFDCVSCHYKDDADKNASNNIRMISVALIHLGQRLDDKGALKMPESSKDRGEFSKTLEALRTLKQGSMKREPISKALPKV
ncbi:MAG: transposase [Oligoflexus sp.]|nr:transposase [Oligoflexus sp.]